MLQQCHTLVFSSTAAASPSSKYRLCIPPHPSAAASGARVRRRSLSAALHLSYLALRVDPGHVELRAAWLRRTQAVADLAPR